jgi:hypothetical protein
MSAPAAKAARKITLRRQLGNEALKTAHPRFRQFLNAKEMDFFLTSNHQKIRTLVTEVLGELRAQGHLPTKRHEDRRKKHLTALLLNLFAAYETNERRHVAIGLNRNTYSERGRYRSSWVSHDITTALLKALRAVGLIEWAKGFRDRKRNKGFVTRIRARRALINKFDTARLQVNLLFREPEYERVRLKDTRKELAKYQDSEQTRSMRGSLKFINSALSGVFIGLEVPDELLAPLMGRVDNAWEWFDEEERVPVDFTNTQLYRVFNDGRFDRGGRFYGGWWQSVRRRLRKHIQIWDETEGIAAATREVDYSSMQPALAYCERGLEPPTDAYAVAELQRESEVVRPLLKAALLRMLNASSRRRALSSLRQHYRDAGAAPDLPQPEEIVACLERFHAPIASMFYQGWCGKYLMYLESQIAEQVMLEMCRRGLVVLPIHDSFIVNERYYEVLIAAMERAFTKRTGRSIKMSLNESQAEQFARAVSNALDPVVRERKCENLKSKVLQIRDRVWRHNRRFASKPSELLSRAEQLTRELAADNSDSVFLQLYGAHLRQATIYTRQYANWLAEHLPRRLSEGPNKFAFMDD